MDAPKLIRMYIKMRDAKSAIAARHKEELAELNGKMDIVSGALKKLIDESGGDSIKSNEFGTASIVVSTKAGCSDWEEFSIFLREGDHDPVHFLEKKLKASAVVEFMDAHEGKLPPGVNIFKETQLRVRKPTAK